MANPPPIEGTGTAHQGLPPMESMEIPAGAKPGGFSSWISKLSSRSARRGSIGFSGESDRISFDDDSNDAIVLPATTVDTNRSEVMPVKDFRKMRNDSMSEMQTPGGDGDLHFFGQYRRRSSADLTNGIDTNGIIIQKDGSSLLKISTMEDSSMETIHSNNSGSFNVMPAITEGKEMNFVPPSHDDNQMDVDSDAGVYMKAIERSSNNIGHRQHQNGQIQKEGGGGGNDSIFLIDLEAVKEGDGVRLKPQSKKFSLQSLLQSNWAQNWFFRNDGVEDDDNANDASDAAHLKYSSGGGSKKQQQEEEEQSVSSSRKSSSEDSTSFAGKIRKAFADHPTHLREMNMWQPQSS